MKLKNNGIRTKEWRKKGKKVNKLLNNVTKSILTDLNNE